MKYKWKKYRGGSISAKRAESLLEDSPKAAWVCSGGGLVARCDDGMVYNCVVISIGTPRPSAEVEADRLREENKSLQSLFDMQQKRMDEATKLWRKENPGMENVFPDLGGLLSWLMKRGDK